MDGLSDARQDRIRELEQRIARRGPGVKWPVAGLAALGAVWLLASQRLDIAYYFSSREPITLGSAGGYRFDSLESNRYAEIHGTPTQRGVYSVERGATYVIVGLQGTPVLVRREAFDSEAWTPGSTPPQPDQRPMRVRGRLLSADAAPRYKEAFQKLPAMGEVHAHQGRLWILVHGERPGSDGWTLLTMTGLGLFAALNLWLCWQGLRRR